LCLSPWMVSTWFSSKTLILLLDTRDLCLRPPRFLPSPLLALQARTFQD
jgi:hypothetical protein